MSEIQASIVVGCDAATAAEAWGEFDFRRAIGRGMGPAGQIRETPEESAAEEERVRFQERPDGSSLVTLTLEYDEDEVDDVSALRADVEDELARYREFIEGRRAA
jgi:hypothetical protein